MRIRNSARLRRTALSSCALLAVGLLGITACSSDESSESGDLASLPTTELPAQPATGTPVKIGLITLEGGPMVSIPEIRVGAEAAVKYVNENAGGLAGHPIDLITCKEFEDTASATSCANQMVEQKVAAVIHPSGSQGGAILPILTGAGIPFVGLNGVAPAEMMSPNSYMLTAGMPGVINSWAAYAGDHGAKKFAIAVSNGGGVGAIVQTFAEPVFKEKGVEVKVVPIEPGTADPTPQLTAGLANQPDAVGILGEGALCISVLRTMQTVAPTQEKYLVPTCVEENVVKAVGTTAMQNSIGFTAVDPNSDDPDSVLYRTVLAKYAPSLSPAGYGSSGYQSVLGLVRAANGIQGDVTPAAITEALRSTKDVALPAGGGITFTCDGTSFPQLKSICSRTLLVGEVNADGVPVDLAPIGA
ncbi:ABC transporter substrate-binding protein [Aldersonia kunmingensis]|uniref:ABC transporter substrate-binding protein n=1 Tax=Aldersonia kunmingensis TaxID=408066 RepID=UPI00082B116A|nr:ABC transporter substrate-binding protein [Aldersonia kunmingensis]